jgi:hypothetical protein
MVSSPTWTSKRSNDFSTWIVLMVALPFSTALRAYTEEGPELQRVAPALRPFSCACRLAD